MVYVQSNDENLVGTQRTIIRGCDSLSNLIELTLYVNISSNSAPEFTEDIKTQFSLTMKEWTNYTLPAFKDPEGNDEGEVYINSMENQAFPEFVTYNNDTK